VIMQVKLVTDNFAPPDESSWLDWYLRASGCGIRLIYCAVRGCPEPPTVGVVVEEAATRRNYVVPMCPKHAAAGEDELRELYPFEQTAPMPN